MAPPKLLDIRVETPEIVTPDADVATVCVLDAGANNPLERVSHVHYYVTAAAVLLESHLQRKRMASDSSSAAKKGSS